MNIMFMFLGREKNYQVLPYSPAEFPVEQQVVQDVWILLLFSLYNFQGVLFLNV